MKKKKQAELNNIKKELLNLTIDAVLKYYFTTEGSEEVLADFLSVAINIPLE